ncbi:hypothetical protein DRJ19_03655, partial [Candidatus Woesearchaeota archaeon]
MQVKPSLLLNEEGRLSPHAIMAIMEKLGFQEAKNFTEHPIVPGSDGMDMYFWRESDRTLVQISYCTGEINPNNAGWYLRFKRNFKPGDNPEYNDTQNFDHEIPAQKIAEAIA